MSGFEVAGIALAVAPLCLYILEHHEAELRPFKALCKYRKQYRRSAEDLGLCLVQLEDTISSVFRDAGISSDGTDIDALVQAYDSSVWNDNDQEAKLIAHFGEWKYEHGFEVKLRQIRDAIMKISKYLGLEKLGTSGDDDEVWSRIRDVKAQQEAPRDPSSTSLTKHFLKSRAKLVFGSISIDKQLECLQKDIQWLATTAESAAKRTSAAKEWRPTMSSWSRRRGPTFDPSLQEIGRHAQRLHIALRDVWSCPQHDCHHVSLRLDGRLKSCGTFSLSSSDDMTLFTLAYAPTENADIWNTVEVCVPEPPDTSPQLSMCVRKPRFAIGPATTSTVPTVSQEQTIRDLCASSIQPRPSISRIYLNSSDKIVQRSGATQKSPTPSQRMRRVSFRSLLHDPHERSMIGSLLTTKQSISLGSTVISTVLQLSATSWLARTWSTDDLFFIKPSGAIDTDQAYVTVAYNSVARQVPNRPLSQSDGNLFVRLGVMLLEIWAQTTIEDLRLKHPTLNDPSTSKGPWNDVATIKEYLRLAKESMQPCFLKAINYCMEAFATGVAGAEDPETHARMIKEALNPFEFELQYWSSSK